MGCKPLLSYAYRAIWLFIIYNYKNTGSRHVGNQISKLPMHTDVIAEPNVGIPKKKKKRYRPGFRIVPRCLDSSSNSSLSIDIIRCFNFFSCDLMLRVAAIHSDGRTRTHKYYIRSTDKRFSYQYWGPARTVLLRRSSNPFPCYQVLLHVVFMADRPTNRLTDWFTGWLAGWLIGEFADNCLHFVSASSKCTENYIFSYLASGSWTCVQCTLTPTQDHKGGRVGRE